MKYGSTLALVLALSLLGCNDGPFSEPPISNPTISTEIAYAGATIIAHAGHLLQRSDTVVWLDTIPARIIAKGGDSIAFVLPSAVHGRVRIALTREGAQTLGFVHVKGFIGRRPVTTNIGFYLDVYPEGPIASLITGDGQGGVQEFFPKTGSVRKLINDGYNLGDAGTRTPGRTPDPSIVLLQPRTGPIEKWHLLPIPTKIDTFPGYNPRHFALFNDSVAFVGTHHWIEIHRYRSGVSPYVITYQGTYEETHEVIISPTRDFATLRVNGSQTGPPVFRTSTGDTAYHVRQLFRSYGAAFSQNGDTLWMLGVTRTANAAATDNQSVLLQIEARTGKELKRFVFDNSDALAMRRDPAGGRIFVAATPITAPYDAPIELYVIDERSFAQIGHVQAPAELTCARWCDLAVLAVGLDGVFLVQPGAWIYEFEYLQQ